MTADARRDLVAGLAEDVLRLVTEYMLTSWRRIAAGIYPPPYGQGGNRGMSSMAPREFPE